MFIMPAGLQQEKIPANAPMVQLLVIIMYSNFLSWVTALPVTKEGKVLMVKQYRHALEEECIELPGGCVDATDADFETAIKREMMEETGYELRN